MTEFDYCIFDTAPSLDCTKTSHDLKKKNEDVSK